MLNSMITLLVIMPTIVFAKTCNDAETFENDFPEQADAISAFFTLSSKEQEAKKLGSGGNGIVYDVPWVADDNLTKTTAALKLVFVREEKTKEQLLSINKGIETEAEILENLNQIGLTRVPKFYACFNLAGIFYLVSEHLPISVDTFYRGSRGKDSQPQFYDTFFIKPAVERLDFYLDLAIAVEEFQNKNFIHNDLKPSNFLLAKDGKAKLIDFGLARKISSQTGTCGGTKYYMDKEKIICSQSKDKIQKDNARKVGYREKVDVWALGVTFYNYENAYIRKHFEFWKTFDSSAKKYVSVDFKEGFDKTHAAVTSLSWINEREINLCEDESQKLCFSHVINKMMMINRQSRASISDVVRDLRKIINGVKNAEKKRLQAQTDNDTKGEQLASQKSKTGFFGSFSLKSLICGGSKKKLSKVHVNKLI